MRLQVGSLLQGSHCDSYPPGSLDPTRARRTQLCPQGSPEQLASQQAVSLLQIKGPNLNLYLRYHKWVSALQAGQHS